MNGNKESLEGCWMEIECNTHAKSQTFNQCLTLQNFFCELIQWISTWLFN
jgi:hypothetical protein